STAGERSDGRQPSTRCISFRATWSEKTRIDLTGSIIDARPVGATALQTGEPTMQIRTLGRGGLRVSALGLGFMSMSEFYAQSDEAESMATIQRALDLAVEFLDTADMYGVGRNEELVGRAIRGR